MAGLVRMLSIAQRVPCRALSTTAVRACLPPFDSPPEKFHPALGKRKILAFGYDGDPAHYYDYPHFPAQTTYFKEDTEYVANVLRPKELGDWREMTIEEKKTLYRTAYRQTVVEFVNQTRGRWKIDLNYNLLMIWLSMIWLMFYQLCYIGTRAEEFEYRQAQYSDAFLANPATESMGVIDMETGEWKKTPWYDIWY